MSAQITKRTYKPLLFAHRGSTLLAPENTQAAFDLALHYQSDVLEIDVRLSRDGYVMVTHDETLDRTTDGKGAVIKLPMHELKKLDAGYRFIDLTGKRYRDIGLKLLSLQELFDLYPGVGVNIDIKDKSVKAAEAVADCIKQYAADRWINVGSFHETVIRRFRQIAPEVSTAASRNEVAGLYFKSTLPLDPVYRYLQIPVRYWGIPLHGQRFISKVQKAQLKVVYWTINDAKRMHVLLKKGANGVVTDRPDIALRVFKEHGIK